MRDLIQSERAELERRKGSFDRFFEELMPVLTEFMRLLQLPDAPMVLVEARRFLPSVDLWMKDQVIEAADKTWLHTRLGYFIGELLVQRFGGCWFVNEIPDSRYFARYVVGRFSHPLNPNAMVDPFDVANSYLSQPPSRNLSTILAQVEAELSQA